MGYLIWSALLTELKQPEAAAIWCDRPYLDECRHEYFIYLDLGALFEHIMSTDQQPHTRSSAWNVERDKPFGRCVPGRQDTVESGPSGQSDTGFATYYRDPFAPRSIAF